MHGKKSYFMGLNVFQYQSNCTKVFKKSSEVSRITEEVVYLLFGRVLGSKSVFNIDTMKYNLLFDSNRFHCIFNSMQPNR